MVTSGTLIAVEQQDLSLPDQSDDKKPGQQKPSPHQQVRAQLAASADARLVASEPVMATPAAGEWVVLTPAADPPTVELPGGTEVVLASGQRADLIRAAKVSLPVGAAARIPAEVWEVLSAVIPDDESAGSASATDAGSASATDIRVPSGATVTASWGATVCDQESAEPRAVHVQAGGKIQIPPDSTIRVMARRIALPGGSDMMLNGTSVLLVSSDDRADPGGMLSIAGSDVTLPKDAVADDVQLPLPAFVTSPSGAKITVNGVAAVIGPTGATVRTRYRKDFKLSKERSRFRLPQGTNSLAGTMGMILLAGLVTMFGIGIELGIVATLVGLSEATRWAQGIMWALLFAVVVFTLHYSVTAFKSLADPEPGSTMSTTAGTSFTL
jgi:hypothetical protein